MFGSSTWDAYLVLRTVRAAAHERALSLLWQRAPPSTVEATWIKVTLATDISRRNETCLLKINP
jgi:hypothetical protein